MALSEIERRFSRLEGSWRCVERRNGDMVVYPPGDDIIHTLDGDTCVCGPLSELITTPCDHDHYMYTHHALDGRP